MKKIFSFITAVMIMTVSSGLTVLADEPQVAEQTTRIRGTLCEEFELGFEQMTFNSLGINGFGNNLPSQTQTTNSTSTNVLDESFEYVYDILKNRDDDYYIASSDMIRIPMRSAGYFLSREQAMDIIERLMYECGELFLKKSYAISVSSGQVTYLGFKYMIDIDTIPSVLASIDSELNQFIDSIDEDLSDLEKTLLAHDYIASISRYQTEDDNFDTQQYHSMYGTFVNGVCVCQGYAEALKYLLGKLDIECVACVCDEIDHVWNCVKLDGEWYHIDLTWNDKYGYTSSTPPVLIDAIEHKHFLTSLEDTITYKNGSDTYDEEDNPILDDNGDPVPFVYQSGDFSYPSGAITDSSTSGNDEFESGYVFNNTDWLYINMTNQEGTQVTEKIVPRGFTYEDGMLVNRIYTEGILFPSELEYEFPNVYATDFAASKPVLLYDGYYHILFREMNAQHPFVDMPIKMKSSTADGSFTVTTMTAIPRLDVGVYSSYRIKDADMITAINNAQNAEFFIWDFATQRPLCNKVRK